MSTTEIADKVNALGTAWEQFKSVNDTRLKELEKKGSADVLLTEQLNKLNTALDEQKSRLEMIEAAASRPAGAEDKKGDKPEQVEYKKAFSNYLRKGVEGNLGALQSKALSVNNDPDGGYLVTPQMSANMINIIFESSPIRQLAAVETISSDALEILEDVQEMSFGWVGEVAARPETNTAQLGKKVIPAHEMHAQPSATQKLLDDASVDAEAWISAKVAERFARAEATAFVNGNGVVQPRGFLTYANGTGWGQIQQVPSGTNGAFDGDDVLTLFYALKEGYMGNASWLMNRSVVATTRTLKETTTGQYLWQPGLATGQPDTLLGRPVYMASDMPVAGTNSLSIAVGDFRRGYTIVDRAGVRILRDPFTNKPYVRFYTTRRVGGDVTNFEAIKLMRLGS
jgi:HK97 family phage major capsid protein